MHVGWLLLSSWNIDFSIFCVRVRNQGLKDQEQGIEWRFRAMHKETLRRKDDEENCIFTKREIDYKMFV